MSRSRSSRPDGEGSRFRVSVFVLVTLLLLLVAPSSLRAAQDAPLTLRCSFRADSKTPPATDSLPIFEDCDLLIRSGSPAVPFRTLWVVLPAGFTVESVSARALSAPVLLPGQWGTLNGDIVPAAIARTSSNQRPSLNQGAGPGRRSTAGYLPVTYPMANAELASVQMLAGVRIALVRVFPLQFTSSTGTVSLTPELEVQLKLAPAPSSTRPFAHPPLVQQSRDRITSRRVENPDLLSTYSWPAPTGYNPARDRVDYLLLTTSNLSDSFQPLVKRKEAAGLIVKVALLNQATNGVPGRDAPERIRNFIRHAYTNWGVQYVLLGGDTTQIPVRSAYVPLNLPAQQLFLPCDLYYACLDGTWNESGDKRWGEASDGELGSDVDLLAEVWIGRAPVDTPSETVAWVEKCVRYETTRRDHVSEALLMGAFLGDYPSGPSQGGDMFTPLLPVLRGFDQRWLDDRPGTAPRWTSQDALDGLNRSPHLALYNGHGDSTTMMRLQASDLPRLTNASPFLLCSVGCNVGQFDNPRFQEDCIAEELVKLPHGGAFAAVVNSQLGWFDPAHPYKYSGEFQYQFLDELLNGVWHSLGIASQRGKENLIGLVEGDGIMSYRWCYYGITLLGDPHLVLQQDAGKQSVR